MKIKYPFIIAEMSGNHNKSLDNALSLVDAAAAAGANAVKIQTYTADTLTIKGAHKITEPSSPWFNRDLYDLYEEAHTPWDWHEAIFKRAKEKNIICFSSPFDETAVDLLESLDNPIYKIASFEINHIPLLKYIASTNKPIIMSTGASKLSEIEEAVNTIRNNGNSNIVLLKCTSTYPASPENTNILTIPHLKKLFNCEVGLSDHTLGIGVSIAAVGLGAKYIEKHFCLDRELGGVDSSFSLNPSELKSLVEESKRAYLSRGKIKYGISEAELKVDAGKRSIYFCDNLSKGDIISKDNIKVIRPGFGLHPRYFDEVLGKKVKCNVLKGDPLSNKNIEF